MAAVVARGAYAQPAAPAPEPGFLTRADFTFGWSALFSDDPRFDWRALIGFDVDLADYGAGRFRLRGAYEATLGHERRHYDLNQGFYFFEASLTKRIGAVEIAGLTQHVSRHLVDRDNAPSISWNTIAGRISRDWKYGTSGDFEGGKYMQQAFVDYSAYVRARVSWFRPAKPNVDLIANGRGEIIWIRREVADRPRQCGGRIEGGIRFNGRAASLEVIAAFERRVDGYPIERFRGKWVELGFRIVRR